MKSLAKLKKIKGDASFREFYRTKVKKSIISGSNKYTGTKEQNIALSEKLGLDLNKYGSINSLWE